MDIIPHRRSYLLLVTARPFNAETPSQALQWPLTPNEQHYVRNHFAIPRHPGKLIIEGLVDHPQSLTEAEVRALPSNTLNVTLECAGNGRLGFQPLPPGEPWGWNAVSTAAWTGVPVSQLLALAHPRPEGRLLVFEGADHGPLAEESDIPYARALPRDEVERLGNDLLVAYAMNGVPLPSEHGAPLRLVVPGWYAMASVKWLQRIQVVADDEYLGPFQANSYVYHWPDGSTQPVTQMQVRALIADPIPGKALARGTQQIRGWAWSGRGAVRGVEVSVDGAASWQPAQLASPASPYAWQAWTYKWTVTDIGRHSICVRASDHTGDMQPDHPAWNTQGYGNHAIQPALFEVR